MLIATKGPVCCSLSESQLTAIWVLHRKISVLSMLLEHQETLKELFVKSIQILYIYSVNYKAIIVMS